MRRSVELRLDGRPPGRCSHGRGAGCRPGTEARGAHGRPIARGYWSESAGLLGRGIPLEACSAARALPSVVQGITRRVASIVRMLPSAAAS